MAYHLCELFQWHQNYSKLMVFMWARCFVLAWVGGDVIMQQFPRWLCRHLSSWRFYTQSVLYTEKHVVLHIKWPIFCLILTKIRMCWQVFVQFWMPNFMKLHSSVLEMLHADRQTDMAKLIDEFLHFFQAHQKRLE